MLSSNNGGNIANLESKRKKLVPSPTPAGDLPSFFQQQSASNSPLPAGRGHAQGTTDGVAANRFPDWEKPSRPTKVLASVLDDWLTWGGYLGIGILARNFFLGSLVAGSAALLGLAFQAYR